MSNSRVFISYSHDSPEHRARVLALAERLRADGIDATLDQYLEPAGPPQGWPRWMEAQLRTADFVVAICSATYKKRVEGEEEPGQGHGVAWEGKLIYQHIYNAASQTTKFVPVLLGEATREDIPLPLQGASNHRADEPAGYESLYRTLLGVPSVAKAELGAVRKSSPGSGRVPRIRRPARLASAAAALLVAVAITAWVWNRPPAEYNVQVTVLDLAGNAAGKARVTASMPAALAQSESGWTLKIAGSSVAEDRKLVIRATEAEAFLSGEQSVQLGRAANLSTTIRLSARTDGTVKGTVVDAAQRAVAGARVSLAGHSEVVLTDANGGFTLPAHAAQGQVVQLRVEKEGYKPVLQGHPAGETPAMVVIDR